MSQPRANFSSRAFSADPRFATHAQASDVLAQKPPGRPRTGQPKAAVAGGGGRGQQQHPSFLPGVDAVPPGGFTPPVGFADWARMVPVAADAAASGGRPGR